MSEDVMIDQRTSYSEIVQAALLSITGDLDEMRRSFHEEATFLLPGAPFRGKGVESYFEASRYFVEAGGSIRTLELLEVEVAEIGPGCAVVTFIVEARAAAAGAILPVTGHGSAVFRDGLIAHLHVTDDDRLTYLGGPTTQTPAHDDGDSGVLFDQSTGLGTMSPLGMWGTPEPA